MKVIFLDIDGVLATAKSYKRQERLDTYYGTRWADYWFYGLEQSAVDNLNTLADTGAVIVISSTWRHGSEKDFRDLVGYLNDFCGIKMPVIGRTGSLRKFNSGRGRDYQRGDEIKDWLKKHPEVTHFVVLDDDADMDAVKDNFVHIVNGFDTWKDNQWQSGVGLEERHVDRARTILER